MDLEIKHCIWIERLEPYWNKITYSHNFSSITYCTRRVNKWIVTHFVIGRWVYNKFVTYKNSIWSNDLFLTLKMSLFLTQALIKQMQKFYLKMYHMYCKFSYRNTMSILVFQSEVVHFEKTELLASLVKKNPTWSLGLEWEKKTHSGNIFWYRVTVLLQLLRKKCNHF